MQIKGTHTKSDAKNQHIKVIPFHKNVLSQLPTTLFFSIAYTSYNHLKKLIHNFLSNHLPESISTANFPTSALAIL